MKKINQWVPFGFGKRICAGESMATSQLFIFFVMLLQQLQFSTPVAHPMPNVNEFTSGFSNIPKPFYVSISSR